MLNRSNLALLVLGSLAAACGDSIVNYPMPCTVKDTDQGAAVVCQDGSSALLTNGENGNDGINGKNGANGLDGADGLVGRPGVPGADGLNGPIGPSGADGAPGATGANGADGVDGAVGPQGPAGNDGTNGADGATGPTGPQGEPGSVWECTIPVVSEDDTWIHYTANLYLDGRVEASATVENGVASLTASASFDLGALDYFSAPVSFENDHGWGSVWFDRLTQVAAVAYISAKHPTTKMTYEIPPSNEVCHQVL